MADTSISQVLSESHSVIYGVSEEAKPQAKEVSLGMIHETLVRIESRLSNIETKSVSLEKRLHIIENKMNNIDRLSENLSSLETKVSKIEREMHQVKKTAEEAENSAKTISEMFDNTTAKTERDLNKFLKEESSKLDEKFRISIQTIEKRNEEIQSSVTDLKSRSMRDNLIFSGIPENRNEDCEAVLQDFLDRKLNIQDISFERVHRMGKYREYSEKPRNIVAKFSFYKDREKVRTRAPRKLKGSRIWVNEQFPPEIEARRKKLYPVMRQAKADNRRVKLVRDILYIDGQIYAPEDTSKPHTANEHPSHVRSSAQNPGHAQNKRTTEDRQLLKRARIGSTPDRT